MSDCLTIYSVPGPSSSPALLQKKITGGWAYALENLEFLTALNPNLKLEVVFGHVKEFGPIPVIPSFPRIKIYVYETSLTKLSDLVDLEPAEQHGAILNFILASHELRTKFYLILDPDCYVVMKNGLNKLIDHMNYFDIDIIGVSYPTTLPKVYYWDFPTAYFQLMNSNKCEPTKLNFLPEHTSLVSESGFMTSNSVPFVRAFGVVLKFIRHFRFPLKRILHLGKNSKLSFVQFIFYFCTNFIYRNTPLFRDTGWANRKLFNELKSEIIPHRIQMIEISAGLNEQEYLADNLDVSASGIDPTWHAIMHGIYERRKFGRQRPIWNIFSKLLGRGHLRSVSFPATSLIMCNSFLSSMEIKSGIGNFQYSYEYFWNREPFCIHLGHGGKEDASLDILKLKEMMTQVIEYSENRRINGQD